MAEQTITILAVVGLMLINTVGVALVALQLPGAWLIVLATGAVAWWQWSGSDGPLIGWWTLAALLGLALLGELLEFLGGALGSSRVGGSKKAATLGILGAIAGALIGSVVIPILIVGTLIGAAVGAGLGALLGQRWSGGGWRESLNVGKGAAIGRTLGAIGKLTVAVIMWGLVLAAALI